MPESDEHVFLGQTFLSIVEDFSKLALYGYSEAERRKFDFACTLTRDWQRALVGQTLWSSRSGMDKDIRSFLGDSQSRIWAYIVRDDIKNRRLLSEIQDDLQRSGRGQEWAKLRVFLVPADFDSDVEEARDLVRQVIKRDIVHDLLFNIVFGHLTIEMINLVCGGLRNIGLATAILNEITTNGFISIRELSRRFAISAGPIREQVTVLKAAGMLWEPSHAYFGTLRGRVFLELAKQLARQQAAQLESASNDALPDDRLLFILEELGFRRETIWAAAMLYHGFDPRLCENPRAVLTPYVRLQANILLAQHRWGVDLENTKFIIHPSETP